MKISKLIIASSLHFHSNFVAADAPSSIRGNKNDFPGRHLSAIRDRKLEKEASGVFLISEVDYGNNSESRGNNNKKPQQTMNVEIDGLIYSLENVDEVWAKANGNGKGIESGQAKIKIGEGAVISGGSIDLHGGAPEVVEEEDKGKSGKQRKLAAAPRTLGDRTVLAVRVVASNGAYEESEEYLSDRLFGTSGATFNFASQYRDCSYNQLAFRAAEPFDNGVITVNVPYSTTTDQSIMVQAVTNKIKQYYSVHSPNNLADHVVYCLPEMPTADAVAYGYVNHWQSVYSNRWCNYPSTLMHEIGHNLGFAHSTEGYEEYGDKSGLMGYSYERVDGPAICFNGPKSFQTKWYQSATKTITPSDNGGNTCFADRLYGIADFEIGNGDKTVIVKINDHRMGQQDYFVAFNRKVGINSGVVEGPNQVLLTSTGREGNEWSLSKLVAKLNAGQAAAIGNFAGTGKRLLIRVESINTASSPGFAQVRIELEGSARCDGDFPPTASPSASPTLDCGDGQKVLTVDVTTDLYPKETSWTLRNICDDAVVEEVEANTIYTKAHTYYSNSYCVEHTNYEFTINDTYGDGICCTYGSGSYSLQYGGSEVASGTTFGSSEDKYFGGFCWTTYCPGIRRRRACNRDSDCEWQNNVCVNI